MSSGFCLHSLPLPPSSGSLRTEDRAALVLLRHRPQLATPRNSLVPYSQHRHRDTRHPMDKEPLKFQVASKDPLTLFNKRSLKCSKAATLTLRNNRHTPQTNRRDLQASTIVNLKASLSRRTTHPIGPKCLHLRRNSTMSRLLLDIERHKRWTFRSSRGEHGDLRSEHGHE